MKKLTFKTALLAQGWQNDVTISISESGEIGDIEIGNHESGLPYAGDCLLPGIANLHSHAHQRSIVGLTEFQSSSKDSFWTWRKAMYEFAEKIKPHHLQAIAAQLYLEMLSVGYTQVAEFQYLHHQTNGKAYDNPAEMCLQILEAAKTTGIGVTCLPVHYQFSGFGEQAISEQQRRFFNTPSTFLELVSALEFARKDYSHSNIGLACHSLRASSRASFSEVLKEFSHKKLPIHIHIAEQPKEVDDCIRAFGSRPVEYCLENFDVNENWCLVHATHLIDDELDGIVASGAVAGLCPTTEANLGDGIFRAHEFIEKGGRFGVGSDSHISVSLTEELRWLEYGQRLLSGQRNCLAEPSKESTLQRSTGRYLFEASARGGAQACGYPGGQIQQGARADFIVLDLEHPSLIGRTQDQILDSWIFFGGDNPIQDVYVAGKKVIENGAHPQQHAITTEFIKTIKELQNTH